MTNGNRLTALPSQLLIALAFFSFSACLKRQVNASEIEFERIQLSSSFYSEGGTHGDFNGDGAGDVAVGPWIYWGPSFDSSSRFYEGEAFPPINYSRNFSMYSDDVNSDGNLDILVIGFPGEESWWYQNPGPNSTSGESAKSQLWSRHTILEYVSNESPMLADMDGDGLLDLICIYGTGKPNEGGRYGFASHASQNPEEIWKFTQISEFDDRYRRFTHGIGAGDVNNDGHNDLLAMEGWWENPGRILSEGETWQFHPVQFSPTGGAHMYAFDIDGDGRNEVVTSLAAHGYGLVYYKSVNDEATEFERVDIMTDNVDTSPVGLSVSQLHAIDLADINRDGVLDLVTGKRWWAHANRDPGNSEPATLLWLETQRSGSRVRFQPHVVDNSSGVGTQIMAGDVNGDGLVDIVSGNKRGAYLFLQRPSNLAANEFIVAAAAEQDRFGQRAATGSMILDDELHVAFRGGRTVNFDFETGDSTDWEIRGPIAAGAVAKNESGVPSSAGKYSLNTDLKGNRVVGEVISRPFQLLTGSAKFLLGGSNNPETRVEIVAEDSGRVIASAVPAGESGLKITKMNVGEDYVGKMVRLRVVDHAEDGHIRFDAFRFEE